MITMETSSRPFFYLYLRRGNITKCIQNKQQLFPLTSWFASCIELTSQNIENSQTFETSASANYSYLLHKETYFTVNRISVCSFSQL